MTLRWKYLDAETCSVDVGGQVLPVEGWLLPVELSPQVLEALEVSPHFVQVPWEAPVKPSKPSKR